MFQIILMYLAMIPAFCGVVFFVGIFVMSVVSLVREVAKYVSNSITIRWRSIPNNYRVIKFRITL
jgi:hypothetical protein